MKPCKISTLSNTLLTFGLVVWSAFLAARPTQAQITNSTTRHAPQWLRNGIMYEIFPRNFSQAGDFNAITAHLDELNNLGVNILWLMPIHPLGEILKKGSIGSPYCVRDFYAINPNYGTTNDFKHLIAEAHKRGMKIIMDIVAGHTSWDSVMMAHPDFYKRDASGHMHPPNPAWTDVAELDYSNPELRRYMIAMMKYWLQDFGVDGFRCDTSFTVPTDFWETARKELEKVNPQVVIITDSGAKPALLSSAFDMDYSGNLYLTLNQVMAGDKPATYLQLSWEHTKQQFPADALHLRFTDHHNMPRATARYGVDGALAAQVMMLTLDGVPLFYNGMEVGDATESADPALFEKMPVFWHPAGRPPLREIYTQLIQLRKQHPAFVNNNVIWLTNTVPDNVVSYLRRDETNEFLVLINLSSQKVAGSVELPNAEEFKPVKISGNANEVDLALPQFQFTGYDWMICQRTLSK